MKLLIELPTWLGDCVMATSAIEHLIDTLNPREVYFIGSFVSIELLKNHPKRTKTFVDNTKEKKGLRFKNLSKLAKKIGFCDICITFRNSFASALLLYLTNSKIRIGLKKGARNLLLTHKYKKVENIHQVEKYNYLVESYLGTKNSNKELKLYIDKIDTDKKLIGINAGASYGNAKRWYPEEFAKVAIEMSKTHDIIIFGSKNEKDICSDIEQHLREANINNYQNLAGETTIEQLVQNIANLDIFVTNDSGPMHIAGVFKIKTFAIFGPTKHTETNQWNNPNETIIRKEMECSPCMKRVCPLTHHECMKLITAKEVVDRIRGKLN
jgi:heptosyltransferase-2